MEGRLADKDEMIKDVNKKSEILEKQANEWETEMKKYKDKNEDLNRQVLIRILIL